MSNYSIGVDLGGTNLRIAALSKKGDLLEKVTLGTRVAMGRGIVIDDMCNAIRQMNERHASDGLQGIGIGVPGIIDMRTACCASRRTFRDGQTIRYSAKLKIGSAPGFSSRTTPTWRRWARSGWALDAASTTC
jgi:hypothetical protein